MRTDKFFEISEKIGKHIPHWTQGTGGNVSYKDGKFLFIKASGMRLDRVHSSQSIPRLEIDPVNKAIESILGVNFDAENKYAAALTGTPKPSMETGMHLCLPRAWVFHFHSLTALVMAHENKKDPARMSSWLERNFPFMCTFLEPIRPGLLLSQRVRPLSESTAIILENHGVLLQANDTSIIDAWEELESKFRTQWKHERLSRLGVHQPTPWRLYFPDSAVFADRLKKIIEPVSTVNNELYYQLKKDAVQVDLDAAELWWATEILFFACPELTQLPTSISGILPNLPTEQYRRGEAQ